MLKTIKLYGVLGKKFGKEFKLAVESTREAVGIIGSSARL